MVVLKTIYLRLSDFYCNRIGPFNTYVYFSIATVLLKIVFLEDKHKDNEKEIWTDCRLDICCIFRNAFPRLQIVYILLSPSNMQFSHIHLKACVIM